MSKIHLEIFDKARQRIFYELSGFSEYGYLAGGTALALQIAHRKSFDFDVFIHNPVDDAIRKKVKSVFNITKYYLDSADQLTFSTVAGVEITFIWFEPKLIEPPVKTASIDLASIIDIATNKTQTLARRAQWRDYVDLFWIMKHKLVSLEQIVHASSQKYGHEFIESQLLEQLTYYKDIEVKTIDFISVPFTSIEIQKFLESEVRRYIKTKIPSGG